MTKKSTRLRKRKANKELAKVFYVFYYDEFNNQVDTTQIDEKDEDLAWSLFEEFGHIRNNGHTLEFEETKEDE